MADNESFDVTSGCDLQEVDNAVNQAIKEVQQRYDFRGLKIEIDFQRKDAKIRISAPGEQKLQAVVEVLESKLAKRKVPLKNIKAGTVEYTGSTARQEITLQQGIPTEIAREIVKFLKDRKLKKVQSAIQGDQLRISSPSRDALQEVIQLLKQQDFGVELSFGNYRSG
jgi:uncharacterized protein YajQ (UPF0234 family)